MPHQAKIPGMNRQEIPEYLRGDQRYITKRDLQWQKELLGKHQKNGSAASEQDAELREVKQEQPSGHRLDGKSQSSKKVDAKGKGRAVE